MVLQKRSHRLLFCLVLLAVLIAGHSAFFDADFHDADEAAYMYVANDWIHGGTPYKTAYQTKPPGIYAIYALGVLITPDSLVGLRILSYAVMGATMYLIFWLILLHFNDGRMILYSGFIGLLLFLHTGIETEAAMTELFVLPFLVYCLYLALSISTTQWKPRAVLATGFMGGAAFLVTFYALPFMVLAAFANPVLRRFRTLCTLALGFCVPVAVVFLFFIWKGAFSGMVFSLFTWPSRYFDYYRFSSEGFRNALMLIQNIWPYLLVAFIGIAVMSRSTRRKDAAILLGWFGIIASTLLFIGSFFPHHAMLIWVPATVSIAFLLSRIPTTILGQTIIIGIVLLLFSSTTGCIIKYRWSSRVAQRVEIGEIIRQIVPENETIFVWGYAPELYWHAKRNAPTPYFDSFSLLFVDQGRIDPKDRLHLQSDFEKNPPRVMLTLNALDKQPDVQALLSGYVQDNTYPWMYIRQ